MPLTDKEYKLTHHLSQYISVQKKEKTEEVLDGRTRYLTVVLEDIYQSHNASAVVRTCECMGIQDIHIIEDQNPYEVNRDVVKGSFKWENLIRYKASNTNNTESCFNTLRRNGYTICATDPSVDNMSIDEIDVSQSKIALVFGNELHGLSEYALKHADRLVKIPMVGFTESFNISVSVAVCLTKLIPKLDTTDNQYSLSKNEKDELRLSWYRRMVKRSEIIEKEFLRANL